MGLAEIEENYVSVPEIANETGQEQVVVHRWIRYFRYLDAEYLKGKPLVKRADFEQFRIDHPELFLKKEVVEAAA